MREVRFFFWIRPALRSNVQHKSLSNTKMVVVVSILHIQKTETVFHIVVSLEQAIVSYQLYPPDPMGMARAHRIHSIKYQYISTVLNMVKIY